MAPKTPDNPGLPVRFWPSKPCRRERNFLLQRRAAKNRPEGPHASPETKRAEKYRRNPRRNGLFPIEEGCGGLEGLDGGDSRDRTANSPPSHRTRLRQPGQERKFSMRRPGAEMASFAAIAGAETAPTREFGRHVFDITALLRVFTFRYNYRVCVVGIIWTELAAPRPVLSNCVSASSIDC